MSTADEILMTLRDRRLEQHLTLAQMAAGMGRRSRSEVCEWESGKHMPSLAVVVSWAEALGYRLELVADG